MKINGKIVRQSRTYTFKEINGVNFMFCIGHFATMDQVRYIARRAALGKIKLDDSLRGVYVDDELTIRQFAL